MDRIVRKQARSCNDGGNIPNFRDVESVGIPYCGNRNTHGPTVLLSNDVKVILSVYEGCNGINVMIVFVAFLAAFGGSLKKMSWFLPAGIILIHLSNLARIILLYFVAVGYRHYFYYVHKYIFTAVIYMMVFAYGSFG